MKKSEILWSRLRVDPGMVNDVVDHYQVYMSSCLYTPHLQMRTSMTMYLLIYQS